jgi:hypothetical protein
MVAHSKLDVDSKRGLPLFVQYDTKRWRYNFGIYLIKKKQAYKGLSPAPIEIPALPANTFQTRFGRYIMARDKWQEQQDSAYSYLMDAECPEALL